MKTPWPLTPIGDLDIGIPRRTLQRWCKTGKVRAVRIGKKYYVDLSDLLRQFREN